MRPLLRSRPFLSPGLFSASLANNEPEPIPNTDTITVPEAVTADFSASPTIGTSPLLVNFTNLSSGDFDTCLWDFGDGSSSPDCNDPSHIYATAGIFDIRLEVSGQGGSDSETKADYIVVDLPVADFSANPTSGLVPLIVSFTNLTSGAYHACFWDFGDGKTNNNCNPPTHTYFFPGSYDVSLFVLGAAGNDGITKTAYIVAGSFNAYTPAIFSN